MLDKLFITPLSWMLAVPVVLLDRLLTTDPAELPVWDESLTADRGTDRCPPNFLYSSQSSS
jgi:hypothetical protein